MGNHKMTEDEVIESLCAWLKREGWNITHKCNGRQKGNDIEAVKGKQFLIVEAKGAKGSLSHTVRERFSSSQIKTHLGKALVKVLEQRHLHPKAEIAIAHPYDEYLMRVMEQVRPEIKSAGIRMYWVENKNNVIVE